MDTKRDFDYIFEVFIIPRWAFLATETGDAALVLSAMHRRHQALPISEKPRWVCLKDLESLPLSRYRGEEALAELDRLGFFFCVSNNGCYTLNTDRILDVIEQR